MGGGSGENVSGIRKLMDKAKEFVAEKVANIPKPEATVSTVDLKHLNRDSLDLAAKVAVNNPYSHPLPICQISYILKSAGKKIASGTIPDPGSLKAKGMTDLDVPVKVPYSIVVSIARDIGTDWDIDYELEINLVIDLPVVGDITIPLATAGEFKLPTLKDFF